MSTPNNTLRQRGPNQHKVNGDHKVKDLLDDTLVPAQKAAPSEWDYKLALAVITALSFATRFFGINHPNEVVFDEVHFGKVTSRSPS
jgi:dolichyl-phosphate-mannose-protein mannosyltransferase